MHRRDLGSCPVAKFDKPMLLYFWLCGIYREEVSEKKKCQQTVVESDLLKCVQVVYQLVIFCKCGRFHESDN